MIVILVTGWIVGCYLVWSFLAPANYPVPHMSDEPEDEDVLD